MNCGKIGLEPLEVNPLNIDKVIKFIHEQQIDTKKKKVIPFAFDYSCSKGDKCEGVW